MAIPSRWGIDKKINSMEGLSAYENGGKGSGNFGHSGRPGEVGGSASGGSYGGSRGKTKEELQDEIEDLNIRISQAGVAKKEGQKVDEGYIQDMMEKRKALRAELGSAKEASKKKGGEISLKGKSLYEKVHMIQPGDTVYIKPQDNLPNFDKKIKVDYIQDGTIHYGASETRDGYTYPAWAIKDITKIERKKK